MKCEIVGVVSTVDGEQVLEAVYLPSRRDLAETYVSTRRELDPGAKLEILNLVAYPRVAATASADSSAALA